MDKIYPSPDPKQTSPPAPLLKERGEICSPFPSGKRAGVATSTGATGGVVREIGLLAIFILQFSIFNSLAWAVRPYTPVHPDPVLEPWRWRAFPELNGLGLRCMAEAKDKAMWFGVDDGVRRYDGIHWTAYTEKDGLYGASVNALCATRDGNVYAGTEKGISRFREGKWSRVFPPEGDPSTGSELVFSETKRQALPWPINDLMESRDGSVWAATTWGALRLSQEGPVLYTAEKVGSALRLLAPYVHLSIVPDTVTPARPWGKGIGVLVILCYCRIERFSTEPFRSYAAVAIFLKFYS